MTYSRRCGVDTADCIRQGGMCACSSTYGCLECGGTYPSADHVCPGEPVRAAESRSGSGVGDSVSETRSSVSEPYKASVTCYADAPMKDSRERFQIWDVDCTCGWTDRDVWKWEFAMDAAHAHVREHHTPTWQPCGRGICAAEAGHEGTCEEASGFVDWTPEFYDDDLDAHRDAMSRGQSARITVTYTRDDPDDQEPAMRIWADAYRANGARA